MYRVHSNFRGTNFSQKREKSDIRDFIFAVAQDFCETCSLSKFGVAPHKLFINGAR